MYLFLGLNKGGLNVQQKRKDKKEFLKSLGGGGGKIGGSRGVRDIPGEHGPQNQLASTHGNWQRSGSV